MAETVLSYDAPGSRTPSHPAWDSKMKSVRLSELAPVSTVETLRGRGGTVDLWYYFYEDVNDASLLQAHHSLMSKDERQRHDRYHFERDRRLFLATRALVRSVLSQYAPVRPEAWCFASNEHGKPYIADPAVEPELHFNLSNTHGLVVCVVSTACKLIGIDAEATTPPSDSIQIADTNFSPFEAEALRRLPREDQPLRFTSYWTLKESYIKARGLGLAIPLDQFSFVLSDEAAKISFDPRLADDASRWRFNLINASPDHLVAVAAKTNGAALSLRAARMVPLRAPAGER
jgi:4'-phosphopantetheinyl transferase